jgi:hypothetical protein
MLRRVLRLILLALPAGTVARLEGQAPGAHASLALYTGFATGSGPSALLMGVELRTPAWGRLSLAATGSSWWLVGVGCDLIIGAPCDKRANALDVGPVIRITPGGRPWRLEATARVGRFWYRGEDRGVWSPSIGLGMRVGESRALGGTFGIHYQALTSGRPGTTPYAPNTGDRVVATAGLRLRF